MNDELFLYRELNTDLDCPGLFAFRKEFVCYSLEDLDRELHSGMSTKEIRSKKIYGHTAVPYGRYEMKWYDSPKHGRVPQLVGVKGFSYVQIHSANWATQLLGCIAPGTSRANNAVEHSKTAFEKIKKLILDYDIKFINIQKMTS